MNLDRVIAVRNNKTIYRDGDRCVKVFNAEFSKAAVLNEALNQAKIEEAGLNVPKILEVTRIDDKWAIVSEYIRGKTLARLMEEEPDKKYIELFVELQLKLHKSTCPLLDNIKDNMRRSIASSGLDAALRSELQDRLTAMPEAHTICHGDFIPSNIIITADKTPYILDWAHATQGDACADAACTYLLLRRDGDANSAEHYLNLFCARSKADRQSVQSWMPIVAAAQLPGSNERAREFLRGCLCEF